MKLNPDIGRGWRWLDEPDQPTGGMRRYGWRIEKTADGGFDCEELFGKRPPAEWLEWKDAQ